MRFFRSYKRYYYDKRVKTYRPRAFRCASVLLACAIAFVPFRFIHRNSHDGADKLVDSIAARLLSTGRKTVVPAGQPKALGSHTPDQAAALDSAVVQHTVVTTIFWVGEAADSDNGYIANAASAWDSAWQQHYGGIDSPVNRNGYMPGGFTPKENPFYFALPYSDLTDNGTRKSTAPSCSNSAVAALAQYSWCKNTWIAITYNGKIAYAQWEDVGPFETDDTAYVFGKSAPKNTAGARAGLDVSPAVQTYLGLGDVSTASWRFADQASIPPGPWSKVITTSLGYMANH